MTNRPQLTEVKLDRDAAIRKIKSSRNRKIFIHVTRIFESRLDETKGYDLDGYIPVNAPTAVKWLQDTIYTDKMAAKVWVRISFDETILFVG